MVWSGFSTSLHQNSEPAFFRPSTLGMKLILAALPRWLGMLHAAATSCCLPPSCSTKAFEPCVHCCSWTSVSRMCSCKYALQFQVGIRLGERGDSERLAAGAMAH